MDLLQELKTRNISINECSKRTGIPYSALFSIVHKKVRLENCQYKTLKKLADFFSCSTDELFTDYTKISIFWKNEKTAEATIYKKLVEGVTSALALSTFFTWPTYWTAVAPQDYQDALYYVFGPEGSQKRQEYAGLIEKLDRYDREVRQKLPEI